MPASQPRVRVASFMGEGTREERPPSEAPVDRGLEEADLPESPTSLPAAALAAHAGPRLYDARQADREIWQLAWPSMLSMVMASLVSLIDIAMIGRLGTEALAAVGYASQYLWLAQSVLFAIGIACVALMARAIGAGDPARARSALGASIVLSVGAAIVVCGLVIAIPALFTHSYLEARAVAILSDIEAQILDFLHLVREHERAEIERD